MAVLSIEIEDLIPFLKRVGGFDSEIAIAKALHISSVTLGKWKKGQVKINSINEQKLREAMSKNKNWGVQLGNVKGSKIEIIQNTKEDNAIQEKDIIYELLIKEIKVLREEVEKYKPKGKK